MVEAAMVEAATDEGAAVAQVVPQV